MEITYHQDGDYLFPDFVPHDLPRKRTRNNTSKVGTGDR